MKVSEVSLFEVIDKLPNIKKFDKLFFNKMKNYDFFLSALGFEERTLAIPKQFSLNSNVHFNEAIYFQYETSTTENAFNEPKLLEYFKKISAKTSKLFCDEIGFINLLRGHILKKIDDGLETSPVKVMFDISVCSSKLILNVVKLLLNLNIELTIVYTEAEKYFPEYSEFVNSSPNFKDKNKSTNETVVLNSDFPGGNKFNPDLVVSFPNFKAQRVKNIISDIDETILLKPDDRLIWIIGDPNMDDKDSCDRKKMMHDVNEIPEEAKIYEVSTLDYKKTIEQLENIYQSHHLHFHINIADLGSKMQTLGICLFCTVRPEISVYNTLPKTYGPSKYSQGAKCFWIIEFEKTQEILAKLNSTDLIEIL